VEDKYCFIFYHVSKSSESFICLYYISSTNVIDLSSKHNDFIAFRIAVEG